MTRLPVPWVSSTCFPEAAMAHLELDKLRKTWGAHTAVEGFE
jgi:hypothetical protein